MPSRKLTDCTPRLAEAFKKAKSEYEKTNPGYVVIVTCTARSTEEQQELYKIGRRGKAGEGIVTQIDGVTKKSNHNHSPSKALDFAIVFNGKVMWNALGEFAEFAAYAKKHGVKWGGDWPTFKDYPHLEVA
jgi:peptidoglycan L-alanyl-D-glutamate endopeptidase CwlK